MAGQVFALVLHGLLPSDLSKSPIPQENCTVPLGSRGLTSEVWSLKARFLLSEPGFCLQSQVFAFRRILCFQSEVWAVFAPILPLKDWLSQLNLAGPNIASFLHDFTVNLSDFRKFEKRLFIVTSAESGFESNILKSVTRYCC